MIATSKRRLGLLCLTVAMNVSVASAGEEDVFDSDTFIDPREIGTELQIGGPPTAIGRFAFTDVQLGYVSNFQDRSLITDDDVGFLTVSHNHYRGRMQWGMKVTGIEGDRSGVRGEFSMGRYALNQSDKRPFVSRSQASITIDEFDDRDPELEISGDFSVQIPGLSKLFTLGSGGIVYSYRFIEGSPNTWRLQYRSSYNLPTKGWKKINANATIYVGYEDRDDRGRLTPVKYKFTFAKQVGRKTQIDLVLAPIYQFSSAGYESGLHFEAYLGVHQLFGHDLD